MSKYPIDLIEKDFVVSRLTFVEIMKKYGISQGVLSYHSKKRKFLKKRRSFLKEVETNVNNKIMNEAADSAISERKQRIQNFKEVIKKFTKALISDDKIKIKSKETLSNAIVEASKHVELLEGNATERTQELDKQARTDRLDRLRSFIPEPAYHE